MRTQFSKIAFLAGIALAMAFTFSCSSSSDDNGGGAYGQPSSSSQLASSSSQMAVSSSSSSVDNNGCGSGKGNNISSYKTTRIGDQVWMAENLDYNVTGSICDGDEFGYGNKYGRRYDWATAMALPSSCNSSECASQISTKHKGVCPNGWHIPSNADWGVLMRFVNPSCGTFDTCYGGAGTKLKATSGWSDYNGSSGGTDDFGFSALPSATGCSYSSFPRVTDYGCWWIASESSSGYASFWHMTYSGDYVGYKKGYTKEASFSVRCLQD